MTEPNRVRTTYDVVRTNEIIGPVQVTGTLTAVDDAIFNNIFFIPEGTEARTMGLQARLTEDGEELAFTCIDAEGLATDTIVFRCPTGIGEPALCIPEFAAQGLIGFNPVNIVGVDADGCFRPFPVAGLVDIACEDLVADPECVEAICNAIAAELPFDPLDPVDACGVLFATAICGQITENPALEECRDALTGAFIAEIAEDQALDPEGPLATAFCDVVEPCLVDAIAGIPDAPVDDPLAVAFGAAVIAVGDELFAAVAEDIPEDPLVAPGPLGAAFCDAVEECLVREFLEIPAALEEDPVVDPVALAFCDAVEACIGTDGLDPDAVVEALQCADLELDTLQFAVEVQAPCVPLPDATTTGGVAPFNAKVSALQVPPPPTDFPNAAFFAVFGDPEAADLPDPVPGITLDVDLAITVDPTEVPPIAVIPTVDIDDADAIDAVSTDIYTFATTADSSYDMKVRATAKAPADAGTIPITIPAVTATITIAGIALPIDIDIPETIIDIPFANIAVAAESTFLVDNTAGVVTVVPMDEMGATTLPVTIDDITTTIIAALSTAITTALDGVVLPPGITLAAIIDALTTTLLPDLDALLGDLGILTPGITATADGDSIVFTLVGAGPGSTISVRAEAVRTPLVAVDASINAAPFSVRKLVAKKAPVKKLVPVKKLSASKKPIKKPAAKVEKKAVVKVEKKEEVKIEEKKEPKKQVRILSKLLKKK